MNLNKEVIRNFLSRSKNFSGLILKQKNNIKKSWDVIEEAIGKTRCNNQKVYPKKVLLGKETTTNSKLIAENSSNFFTEIKPKLASEFEKPTETFDV